MPKGQVLLMRCVAMIMLMILIVLSYTGYSQGIPQEFSTIHGTQIVYPINNEIHFP